MYLHLMDALFRTFTVNEDEVNRIAGIANDPHSHDFEELIIGIQGQLEHFIDFASTTIDAPFVSFVTKGKIHRVVPRPIDGQVKMYVFRFKSEFIPETTFQLYSYYHDHATIQLERGECFQRLVVLAELIIGEMQRTTPDYPVIRPLLSALFAMIESERKLSEPVDDPLNKTQNTTFKNFLAILEENFRRPEGVEFYAEKLFMSARNLNTICQNIMNKSVSEMIETRKLIEAKNLLLNSDMTIAEIGFELGYQDKSYFTSVFKKKSGQTPSEFREEMRKLIS
jgi:AraC family transcriptional activator of pobA